ncbi:hypothetical protein ALC57_08628, partial [Trachymyrmex cornetzi]
KFLLRLSTDLFLLPTCIAFRDIIRGLSQSWGRFYATAVVLRKISLLRFDSVKSIVNRHFVEVSANMISWSKVASQTTASSRNYAWVVSPGSSCWLTRQTERCGRTSQTTVLTWRRFSNAVANSAPRSIIAIRSIRNAVTAVIVSDIYDFYVSIHAFKSNYLVVPVWRVIRYGCTQALYRREPFDRDLRLIKSHVTRGLSGEHKRCRFN